jgi:hypothetical protein
MNTPLPAWRQRKIVVTLEIGKDRVPYWLIECQDFNDGFFHVRLKKSDITFLPMVISAWTCGSTKEVITRLFPAEDIVSDTHRWRSSDMLTNLPKLSDEPASQ